MRIIKKGGYYYLKHSFRKGGKVVTREKYLGREFPENIEEAKHELQKESQRQLYIKLEKIRNSFHQEWKRCPESAKQKEKEEIAIAFTYNTNAIEGSAITLEETREIIVDGIAPNKPLKDIRETEAHFKTFLEILDKPEKISKELLFKWHKSIFGETKPDIAGRFRDFSVRVGPYRAPDWQDMKRLMSSLFNFLKEERLNPVELAARAHYRFEKIHPFGDGNGRIGRLIMNRILWHKGYPMIIIEHSKRQSYYKALQRNEDGFVNYFLRRYLTIHKKRHA